MKKTLSYLILGIFFGIVMYKSEAASWFSIYEMFRFGSFKMYGIIGSAVFLGIIGIQIIKRKNLKAFGHQEMRLKAKDRSVARYLIGGTIFGLGWALAGACPGPIFVLFGAGFWTMILVIVGAILGTLAYGMLKKHLPR